MNIEYIVFIKTFVLFWENKMNEFCIFFLFSDTVVIYSEKDEYDKLKATPQKAVKR